MKRLSYRKVILSFGLGVVLFLFAIPLLYIVLYTFLSVKDYYGDGSWNWTLTNLQVIRNSQFLKSLLVSCSTSLVGAFLSLILTIFGGYGFYLYYPLKNGRLALGGRLLLNLFLFSMVFHGGIIAFYMLVRYLGLINSYGALVIPYLLNTMLVLFALDDFRKVSPSLLEVARLEGLNEWKIFARIIIPLKQGLIFSLFTLSFIFHWNNWYPGVLFIHTVSKEPVQVYLRNTLFSDSNLRNLGYHTEVIDQPEKMAYVFISIIPILIGFLLLLILNKSNEEE